VGTPGSNCELPQRGTDTGSDPHRCKDQSKQDIFSFLRDLVRQHHRFFLFTALAGLALRLFFIFRFPAVTTDSFIYGDIAKNWLLHGIYGVGAAHDISATYIRLPGYPAFLALIFALFGMEHYRAALWVQMFVDMGTCFLIADIAGRLIGSRAARAAFLLAALCPFLADYAAAALTETLEIFFTTLALDFALAGLDSLDQAPCASWCVCGLSAGASIVLRPDGGLLLCSIGIYLAGQLMVRIRESRPYVPVLRAGLIFAAVSIAPLVPWTVRNLHTMHRFEPLAPRYANEEDEFVPMGFNRWVKTWMADYASVEEIYWPVPGDAIDAAKLPARAFDSVRQRAQTEKLIVDYDAALHVTPALDAQFSAIAAERVRSHPLRYYVWLPLLRVSDMWLRPRTELLPSDPRWWEFNDDPWGSAWAVSFGVVNLLYIVAALVGLIRARLVPHLALLLTFVILRSAFLGTLENPEPRYVLEMYPVVIILAAAFFADPSLSRS
jgi:4-amino-4-deoxy-L-arabinose transferase-like glycosyltransferase